MYAPVIVSMALAGSLLLVGCGSERATEQVTEAAVVATYAAAETTPDLPAFTADVSGDTSVEMPPGEIVYRPVGVMTVGGQEIPPHRELLMSTEVEGRRYELRLMFADNLDAGTYEINEGAYEPTQSSVAAELAAFPVDGGLAAADAVQYNNTVEGTLTLAEVGRSISGHFEFTAEATRTLDGAENVVSIMVAGTFEDVEFSDSADVTETPDAGTTAEPAGEPTGEATSEAG